MTSRVISSLVAVLLVATTALAASKTETNQDKALDHYRAGQKAMASEDWAGAEREFKAAIELDPLLVLAHYGLGQVYMFTKRYPDAVRAFIRCRQAFHEEQSSRLMGSAEYDKRLDDQIRALQDNINVLQRIGSPSAQVDLPRLQDQVTMLEGQKHKGDRVSDSTPPFISVALGSAHFRTGAFADAEREYRAALAVDAKLGEAHNNLAVVLMLTGRLEDAGKEVRLAEKAGFKVSPAFQADLKRRQETAHP